MYVDRAAMHDRSQWGHRMKVLWEDWNWNFLKLDTDRRTSWYGSKGLVQ